MPPEPSVKPAQPGPSPETGAGPSDDLAALKSQLDALTRRERGLLVLRALLQVLVAVAAIGLLGAGLLSAGVGRDLALLVVVLGGALLLTVAALYPLASTWRAAGDLLRQARRVEQLQPALRSRLVTAVDRGLLPPSSRRPGVQPLPLSSALLARAVARARVLSQPVAPTQVHGSRPVRWALAAAVLAMVLVALSARFLPVGPYDALLALATGRVAAARMADGVKVADATALVGDINLRYVFPDYTGLDPVDVPTTDGTIHAPRGTLVQINARTAELFDAAAIQVDQGDPVDALLAKHRDISGSLTVTAAGTWRFVLFTGDRVLYSPDYAIVVEDDAAPVVTAASDRDAIAVDAPLSIPWQADDDFGIQRVALEIEQDGQIRQVELRRPLDARRRIGGVVMATPRELGLSAGDQVSLRVVAVDNDQVTGGKRGESAAMAVKVLGAQAAGRGMSRYYQALRDTMVRVLADFLVESDDLPIANDPAAMQRWVGKARLRFDPVRAVYDRQWGDDEPDTPDGELTRQVFDDAAVLFRFTLTTFDPNTNRRVKMTDLDTFNQLHDTEIETLEVTIGLLDSLLQRDAMADVNDAIRKVAQEAQELSAMAQDAEAAALLARLDQLQRLMAELSKAAARLSEGQLREFLNSRLKSAGTLMDEIRKAIAEGRMDDARAMLKTLSEQLQQLSQGIEDQVQASQQQDDQLGKKLKETMDALHKLEQDQDALADKLSQARESQDGDFQQQVDAWTRMDVLAETAVKQAQGAVDASGDGRGWRVENIRRLERERQVVGGLRDAVRARDIPGARERVENADFARRQARVAVEREAGRSRLGSDAIPDGLRVASSQVHGLENTLSELAQLLEQVQQHQRRISPESAQQARELSRQQQALRQQQQRLQRDVQGIERQLPTSQGQAGKAMDRAGKAMDRAGDALDEGQPTPGEGHMRDAAEQVAAARKELQHQQQQMQQMQQMQQQMRGKGGGRGERKDGQAQLNRPRMEIPAPESFRTPEQYRKALLEGMEAEVPEEYEALKKQYYEELVRQ